MGIVTGNLGNTIACQVAEHRLVAWFDPEQHYADVAQAMDFPETTIARYDGSFFALRHQIRLKSFDSA